MNAAERGSAERPAVGWSDRARAVLVPLTLLVLAGLLLANPLRYAHPYSPPRVVPAWVTDTSPVRHPRLKPEITSGSHAVRCSECHKLIQLPPETTRPAAAATGAASAATGPASASAPAFVRSAGHPDIQFNHGINQRCFNCHNPSDLDTFVDNWGKPIPYDQPPLVCAKCHGPVYRDWLHGSHGRVNGYWRVALAPASVAVPQQRRKCVECHDPHAPPFQPLHPAAPPVTLRMGDQQLLDKHAGEPDPLRVYRKPPVSEEHEQR